MRAGDLAAHGLGALDASGVEVRAGELVPPVHVSASLPVLPPPPIGARPRRTPRASVYPAAAVAEIRRRLDAVVQAERDHAAERALALELARAQAAIVAAQETLDAIGALEQSMRRASGDGR